MAALIPQEGSTPDLAIHGHEAFCISQAALEALYQVFARQGWKTPEAVEREAIQGEGSVRGETPHFPCPPTDKCTKNSGPPRAVIPSLPPMEDLELSPEEQRESLETQNDGAPLHRKRLYLFPKPEKDFDGELVRLGNGEGENQEQARSLYCDQDLPAKAQRLACCGRFGHRLECPRGHKFFEKYFCGQRFCRTCAPRNFQRLFRKYVRLEALVKKRPHWVLAKLDFTIRNAGVLPTPAAIREMNRAVRRTLRRLWRAHGVKEGAGYLWCDEFGFDNTNLHAHGLYYGPFLPFEEVQLAWAKETGDDLRVSIQSAHGLFPRALYHLLKYVSKPPSDDPKRLAELEAAHTGVRRVHTMGIFYNCELTADEKENRDPADSGCPCCGGALAVVGQWSPVKELEVGGLRDVEEVRRELRRQRTFSRDGPWVN